MVTCHHAISLRVTTRHVTRPGDVVTCHHAIWLRDMVTCHHVTRPGDMVTCHQAIWLRVTRRYGYVSPRDKTRRHGYVSPGDMVTCHQATWLRVTSDMVMCHQATWLRVTTCQSSTALNAKHHVSLSMHVSSEFLFYYGTAARTQCRLSSYFIMGQPRVLSGVERSLGLGPAQ